MPEKAFAEALWMCIQFAGRVLHTLMTFAKLVRWDGAHINCTFSCTQNGKSIPITITTQRMAPKPAVRISGWHISVVGSGFVAGGESKFESENEAESINI